MMEENNDIFLAGNDALVYLAGPMHKKYSTSFDHLFAAIYLMCTYLRTNFSTPPNPNLHTVLFKSKTYKIMATFI